MWRRRGLLQPHFLRWFVCMSDCCTGEQGVCVRVCVRAEHTRWARARCRRAAATFLFIYFLHSLAKQVCGKALLSAVEPLLTTTHRLLESKS